MISKPCCKQNQPRRLLYTLNQSSHSQSKSSSSSQSSSSSTSFSTYQSSRSQSGSSSRFQSNSSSASHSSRSQSNSSSAIDSSPQTDSHVMCLSAPGYPSAAVCELQMTMVDMPKSRALYCAAMSRDSQEWTHVERRDASPDNASALCRNRVGCNKSILPSWKMYPFKRTAYDSTHGCVTWSCICCCKGNGTPCAHVTMCMDLLIPH